MSLRCLALRRRLRCPLRHRLPPLPSQADSLAQLFKEWDANNDGTISKKEFRRGVATLRLVATKVRAFHTFDHHDPVHASPLDAAACVLPVELCSTDVHPSRSYLSQVQLNELFDAYDHNGSGVLEISELRSLLVNELHEDRHQKLQRRRSSAGFAEAAAAAEAAAREAAAANDMVYEGPESGSGGGKATPHGVGQSTPRSEAETNSMPPPRAAAGPARLLPSIQPAQVAPTPPAVGPAIAATGLGVAQRASSAHHGEGGGSSKSKHLTNTAKKTAQGASRAVKQSYRVRAAEDLDLGRLWTFKVFPLQPPFRPMPPSPIMFSIPPGLSALPHAGAPLDGRPLRACALPDRPGRLPALRVRRGRLLPDAGAIRAQAFRRP